LGTNQHQAPLVNQPLAAENGGLKGTTPAMFDENWKNMKQFFQEFLLY
jgi:hypothetical protein